MSAVFGSRRGRIASSLVESARRLLGALVASRPTDPVEDVVTYQGVVILSPEGQDDRGELYLVGHGHLHDYLYARLVDELEEDMKDPAALYVRLTVEVLPDPTFVD